MTSQQRLAEIHSLQALLSSSLSPHDVIELAMACTVSLPISESDGTALLWLLIAGAPSSAKTETVLTLTDVRHAFLLDTLTENSFISGYLDPKTGMPTGDLLQELHGKCLIIKDLTTLFSMRDDKVKKILGDLQSIYDGTYTKYMVTRGKVSYKAKFSMIGCVTPAALTNHHRYMSAIGGRFLMYRVPPLSDGERDNGFALSWTTSDRSTKLSELHRLVAEHVANILSAAPDLQEERREHQDVINRLALLLARGRAVIQGRMHQYTNEDTGKAISSYELDEAQIEEPWRGFQQLRNLGRALAQVHGRKCVTDHEIELLRRVALSSIPVDRYQILCAYRESPEGLTVKLAAKMISKSTGRARQLLDELAMAKLLITDNSKVERAYRLHPGLKDLILKPTGPIDHEADLSDVVIKTPMKPMPKSLSELWDSEAAAIMGL